ncbi:Phospho-2-dehydro-3-deoxyheptonate aldolase [Mycena chlorophos]|uniref:Phospho-2-dehydro-3-deoxyheptonate aldolase n=1 Tax=Mycena chlorophos TaxID=658473 RepID=A0A8H6TQ72_MYCCL|nr:Phospho-2-dehydro-3-deoxyheptonate aldolase [Mycena chlorophos]
MPDITPVPDFEDAEKVQQYIQDRRVIGYDPLVQPALLRHEIVASANAQKTVAAARYAAARIVAGQDDRLLVILGPCSIHSTSLAMEYAALLKAKLAEWPNLFIIMRAYLCDRLINDPEINGSFKINKGLRLARQLLCDITDLGIPVGQELLDTISPQYLADLLSWAAIGARTTESQLHRELASGVSFPIGFKNGTDASVSIAIDAMQSAGAPHAFMGVTEQGLAAIVKTRGNLDTHVILRGGNRGPNYASEHVKAAVKAIQSKNRDFASLMVDCSHGNSQKNFLNQPRVLEDVCAQLAAGERNITGVMVESNINEGRQDVPSDGPHLLKHGVSITDACVNWETTVAMMDALNRAVGQRRQALIDAGFSRPPGYLRSAPDA